MSHRSTWPPVYPGLNASPDVHRISDMRALGSDVRLLISVMGNSAIITYICQTALKQAADHARSNNFTLSDSDALLAFVRRERPSPQPPPGETLAPHVPGRGEGGREQAPGPASLGTKPRQSVARGSGPGTGKAAGGKGKGVR